MMPGVAVNSSSGQRTVVLHIGRQAALIGGSEFIYCLKSKS